MAKGGRRAGAGRKTTGKVAMLVRVDPDVRGAIERAARRSGRSLSAQAEAIFLDVQNAAARNDELTRTLAYLVTQTCTVLRGLERAGSDAFDWRTSRSDFDALRAGLSHVLDRLAPDSAAAPGRFRQYESPAHAGRVAADVVLVLLAQEQARMHAIAKDRGADTGSIFYAYPQAAQTLARK
jgi:hypothetical protein